MSTPADAPRLRVIGMLGGMSWESTAEYYRLANELVRERLGGLHSARIVLASMDFAEIEHLQATGQWERTAELLAEAAESVEAAGADLLLICTNTMHKVAGQIQDAISIPPGSGTNGLARVPPMPSGEGLPAQRGVRVHHLEVEERTVIDERRRNVAEQFEGDGTVQLGVGDHARSEGAVGKAAAPVVLVAPGGELPAQGCRCGRFDAFGVDLIGGDSSPHDREEDVDGA
jgi:Asp/Glu/Hydantoin racemase